MLLHKRTPHHHQSKITLSGLIMLIIANLSIYPFESTTRTKYNEKQRDEDQSAR